MEVEGRRQLYDGFLETVKNLNTLTNMINKKTSLIALLACVAAGELPAGTITNYAAGDVLLCFRKGGNDMVVDAGQIATLTNYVSANHRIPITQYTGTQLAAVGTNGVSWSAFTWSSDNTLFVTRPRTSVNVQTAPWQAQSSSVQHNTVLRMQTIPIGALDQLKLLVYPDSTSTAVIEEDDSQGNPNYPNGVSYHWALSGAYGGNFNNTFVGNPENTTLSGFTTSGQLVRSDFYQITPTGGYAFAKWLGYFEFNTNGAMTYVAYPTATPVISSINRAGNTTTINYKSGLYGTYTLRGTSSLVSGESPTNWPAITALSSGDTASHVITDTTADNVKFYTITAQ
jgi:hypothetical protein